MKEKFFKFFAWLVAGIGLIASVITIVNWQSSFHEIVILSLSSIVLILSIIILSMFLYIKEIYIDAQYKPLAEKLHSIVHKIRDIMTDTNIPINNKLSATSKFSVEQLSNLLTLIKKSQIDVTITTASSAKNNHHIPLEKREIKTVIRNESCSNLIPEEYEEELSSNYAYRDILKGKNGCRRYFLSNNLMEAYKNDIFKNSFLSKEENKPVSKTNFFGSDTYSNWALYLSCIIVPIRKYSQEHSENNDGIYGFIIVSSNKINCFNEYDCEIVSAIADMLYCIYDVSPLLLSKSKISKEPHTKTVSNAKKELVSEEV